MEKKELLMSVCSKCLLISYVLFASFNIRAEVSYNVTFVTDYLFEGITQTDNSPALQANVDYGHDSGFYVGAWGSNVDFGSDASGLELDLYLGFAGSMTDNLEFDFGYVEYLYLNDDNVLDGSEFSEFYAKFTLMENTKLSLWFDDDKDLWGGSSTRIKIEHTIFLPNDYNLDLSVHNWSTDWWLWDNDNNPMMGEDSYVAYMVGISKEFNDFLIAINFSDTSIDNVSAADSRLFLSVRRSF